MKTFPPKTLRPCQKPFFGTIDINFISDMVKLVDLWTKEWRKMNGETVEDVKVIDYLLLGTEILYNLACPYVIISVCHIVREVTPILLVSSL